MKSYLLLFLTLVCAISYGQNDRSHCKILKDIKLKYTQTDDQSSYIIIKNNDHIEYHRNGKYFIKSKLVWISDCEYNMTMTDNIAEFSIWSRRSDECEVYKNRKRFYPIYCDGARAKC